VGWVALRCVWEGAERGCAPGGCARRGRWDMQGRWGTLIAACQVAGIGAAALILLCYLIDLAFDTDFLSILTQAMLAAFACALILAVWTDQQE
jgi:hypothetical protein